MKNKPHLKSVAGAAPEPGSPARLHTLQQIATAWGTSRAYVYGLVVRGDLRAIVLPSKAGTYLHG